MEKKEETLLTNELYESIINELINDVLGLKKEQEQSITKISREKETLRLLKNQLKLLKKDISNSKKLLSDEKRNLKNINSNLDKKNNSMISLNCNFITEEENFIDLNKFAVKEKTKKR